MLLYFLVWISALVAVFAAGDPLQLQSLDVHRVSNVEDLTPEDLKSYSVIFVKNETSLILSKFLHERANDPTFFQELRTVFNAQKLKDKVHRNKQYVQTHYSRNEQPKNTTEKFPLDGCFDNTHSDTTSLISRSYEKTMLRQGSLNLLASLMGFEFDAGSNAGFVDVFEEKIICNVKAGQKLQLQTSLIRKKMRLHRQRTITIHSRAMGSSEIEFSDWGEIDGPNELELVMRSIACVTDEEFLQC